MNDKFKDVVWSYSRVDSFNTCPLMFNLTYINKSEKQTNAFAQYGTFAHELIENVLNGSITSEEAIKTYKRDFNKVITEKFPWNRYSDLKQKYFWEGLKYLKNMKWFDKFKIIQAEEEFKMEFASNIKFRGYIDLLMESDKGELIVLDHKSKGSIEGDEKDKYFRQLYLYSFHVQEKYGRTPTKLVLNLFRSGKWVVEDFDRQKQLEALSWFVSTIEKIKLESEWNFKRQGFFCEEICSHRAKCKELRRKLNE